MVLGAAFRRVNVILGHIEDNKKSGGMECEAKISNRINTATLRLILELNLGFHASRIEGCQCIWREFKGQLQK